MVRVRSQATLPLNPPGAARLLTHNELWNGILTKSRDPSKFIGNVFANVQLTSESAHGMTRIYEFVPGMGPPGKIHENVTFQGNNLVSRMLLVFNHFIRVLSLAKATFHQIQHDNYTYNQISGSGTDIYLTFNFDWNFPNIAPGSREEAAQQQKLNGNAVHATQNTLDSLRRMYGA
jgi:Domain of unknown function (DUF1857)